MPLLGIVCYIRLAGNIAWRYHKSDFFHNRRLQLHKVSYNYLISNKRASQCDLCDASYVSYTLMHLHQRMPEHTKWSSSIGNTSLMNAVLSRKKCTDLHFSVLRKCINKFDCLVHEMLPIRELTPYLKFQSD